MFRPDCHIHTQFSPDSTMSPEEAVKAAVQANLTHICFTDHMDLGHHMESFNCIPDFAAIYASIRSLSVQHPEIQISFGIEAGYLSKSAIPTAQIIAQHPFDYVLLSTHCVDGLDCYLPESKRSRDKTTAYRRYLETVYDSVCDPVLFPLCDCIGHIGYIAKCRHYEDNNFPYSLFPDLIDSILTRIIRADKGIEVNTSGIDRAGHILPHPSIIARYQDLGGRIITIGSDAHTSGRIGAHVPDAIEIIKYCGFHEIAVFEQRIPRFFPI